MSTQRLDAGGPSPLTAGDSKWGHLISKATRWRLAMDVAMSDHAADRWDDRTPAGSISPEAAFERAIDVTRIRDHIDKTCDSVHYFHGVADGEAYGAVFLERDGIIFSVYDLARLDHGPTRCYLAAFNNEFVVNGGDAGE